jgi:protein-tyrosine-phosphatase
LVTSRRSSADGRDVYYAADLGACRRLFIDAASELHPGLRLTPGVEAQPRSRGTVRVLFLCTGNSARSQIAAALLSKRAGGALVAHSAGSNPKPLHPHAIDVMRARGIDVSGARPTHLRRYSRTRFARVVTLCDKVREVCPEFPGPAPVTHWSMPDPSLSDDGVAAFEAVAVELERRIDFLIPELATPSRGRTAP